VNPEPVEPGRIYEYAIALALRCGAKILVSEKVFVQSSIPAPASVEGGEKDKWTELLEKMDPEQFSKYKM